MSSRSLTSPAARNIRGSPTTHPGGVGICSLVSPSKEVNRAKPLPYLIGQLHSKVQQSRIKQSIITARLVRRDLSSPGLCSSQMIESPCKSHTWICECSQQ